MYSFVNKDNSFIKFITNGNKKENSILAFLGLVAEVDAQLRLSQLDLSRATQTYGTLVTGRSVTGEEAFVAGEKCEDPVGVHSKSIIRINVKDLLSGYQER